VKAISQPKREIMSAVWVTKYLAMGLIAKIKIPLESVMSQTGQIFPAGRCMPSIRKGMERTSSHSNGNLIGLSDVRRISAAVEAINNLVYLAAREADNPESVRQYLRLAEQQVASLTEILKMKSREPIN
jgi:hypothetical protein